MTEDEVITRMRVHLEGLFPKTCPHCRRRFVTLRDYLRNTVHQGSAMCHDAEAGNWRPANPIGAITLANCSCGNTLALSSDGMPLSRLWPRNDRQTKRDTQGSFRGEEETLDFHYIRGLKTFGAFGNGELDGVSFIERFEA
jgi:hypothetical protein